ncbi:phosphonate ABC transporter, permease protein PhnE [Halomonas elongata]|uniref:phosphonate ABC transporter, permease protein PhnE n=1 Tax=Halomonas elongata TaxID=2746 RepID=UPI002E298339|nr:phosphonate ABC transporter, permease protein PhnE [Halomonas elongata]WVI72739.1 phosphonate ABC transporter, permease protein PhnE [Halomonas elongata]
MSKLDPGAGEPAHYSQVWAFRTPRARLALWFGWLVLVALFVWCWQLMNEGTMWMFVADAPRQAADIGSRLFPPKLGYLPELLAPLWDTLNIATLGTLGGVIMAVPVAFLAARNTTPSATLVRPVALLVIVASRSINSLIWALLLVAIIGPGLLAGIVAIALRSIGFVGKLLYEAIEETDAHQIEAVTATGARSSQVIHYGIVPQVLPAFWGISVFRWDINIRESTILGLVGAGGIGMKLQSSIDTLAWSQVATILIVILATVVVSETISARMRQALI